MIPSPPVVVDADVLRRNVDYALRRGYPGALLGQASPRYSLLTGLALFAEARVGGEAIHHLPDIASDRNVPLSQVREVWNQVIVPHVRFVSVTDDLVLDPRIAGIHPKDVPSALLTSLLAPAVLSTDNRKDYKPFEMDFPRFSGHLT